MTAIEQRGVFWVAAPPLDKVRICVVLSVETDYVLVVYGQSRQGSEPDAICVTASSVDGRRMELRNDTFFRVDNVRFIRRADFRQRICTCTNGIFPDFLDLAGRGIKRMSAIDAAFAADLFGIATPEDTPQPQVKPPPES